MEADTMSGLQRFTDAQKMDFDTCTGGNTKRA